MEKLTHMLKIAIDQGFWKLIKLSRNGPKLSHLSIVDDLVLLAKSNLDQVEVIKKYISLIYFAEVQGKSLTEIKFVL